MFRFSSLVVLFIAVSTTVLAQPPYAGMQTRPIKALSEQQIADLKAGRGMGLALAAELNGYPGPTHVLELADELELSDAQRSEVKAQLKAMKAETIPVGERLIEQERALDRLFADRVATLDNVSAAVSAVAATEGTLRTSHLKYHLSTIALLSAEQVKRYAELRGYGSDQQPRHHHQ